MSKLLLIETSTSLCSAAIAIDGRIAASRRSSEPRAHASLTAVFVKDLLDECNLRASDLDAVAVSMGPGSYTGLRVGVSTAKGLCFGAGIPLIAVSTLDILAWQAIEGGLLPEECAAILPMVDARRMEVYAAAYSPAGERLSKIAPVVIDAGSFSEEFAKGPVLVIGDAADKCRGTLPAAAFVQVCPEATAMLTPATTKYEKKEFEDVAYFEPFYLKQFVATVGKKLF